MNWYSQSPANWSSSEKNGNLGLADISSAEALNLAYNSVSTLRTLLKDHSYLHDLSTQSDFSDLGVEDQVQVSQCISDALRCLNKLASSYNVLSPMLFSPLALKTETILTNSKVLPSNFPLSSPLKDELNPFLSSDQKFFQAKVDDSCISVGSVFSSLEDASLTFDDYATKSGFTTCKGNSKKDVYQEFACSARGKVRVRKVSDESKQRNRKSIKKMCKCHIILRKKHNFWVITTRKLVHTHELLSIEEIKKTAKNRFIPEDCKLRAVELYEKGEPPAKIQLEFESQLKEKCTWSMKDLYNMLYKHKSINQ